jgi:hypothetical protein
MRWSAGLLLGGRRASRSRLGVAGSRATPPRRPLTGGLRPWASTIFGVYNVAGMPIPRVPCWTPWRLPSRMHRSENAVGRVRHSCQYPGFSCVRFAERCHPSGPDPCVLVTAASRAIEAPFGIVGAPIGGDPIAAAQAGGYDRPACASTVQARDYEGSRPWWSRGLEHSVSYACGFHSVTRTRVSI